ncbi:MAG: hypothetical protein EAZ71_11135, partial [Verrucomicrobia bacterium]
MDGRLRLPRHRGTPLPSARRGSQASCRKEGPPCQDRRPHHADGGLQNRQGLLGPGKASARRGLVTHVIQALRASGRQASVSKVCDWFCLPRSSAYYQPREAKPRPIDEDLATRIKRLHNQEPACGVRGTWSRLRFIEGIQVNRKKVHRIMKLKGWTLPKRKAGSRPRVRISRSIADRPDQRWATDLALIHCGRDGWCVFVPVIDCCTREILGHALEPTGRAKTAER